MPPARPQPPIRIAILAFDGCLTSAVTGVLDAFRIANQSTPRQGAREFATSTLASSSRSVRGSSGFSIPAMSMKNARHLDVAIVPPIAEAIPETLRANADIVAWLKRSRGGLVASVCTGAFFLAEAGLLHGRRATTNPIYADALRAAYRDVEVVPEERLTDEGRVLCAGSTTAFLDLAIYLIDRFAGHEAAVFTAKRLCMDKNHRSQLPYFQYVAPKDHGDDAVLGLQAWMEAHFDAPLTMTELAHRGAMSLRSLSRRFHGATGMSPTDYMHRVRTEAAKRLLETSSLSVDEITSRVGYVDARSFSRLFQTLVGVFPREYRTRFGAQQTAVPVVAGARTRSLG